MRRLFIGFLTSLLILCPACTAPDSPKPDTRWTDIIAPAVQVLWDDYWMGSGTVVGVQCEDGVWFTYVLTAAHVVVDKWNGSVPNLYVGVSWSLALDGEKTVDPWTAAAEILYVDELYDLALLRAEYQAPFVAHLRASTDPLEMFTPAYTVGCSVFEVPIANLGEITWLGTDRGVIYTSAHLNYGYSGGGLYVQEGDHWVLVGVNSFIGVGPIPYFHAAGCMDIQFAQEWLEEVGILVL